MSFTAFLLGAVEGSCVIGCKVTLPGMIPSRITFLKASGNTILKNIPKAVLLSGAHLPQMQTDLPLVLVCIQALSKKINLTHLTHVVGNNLNIDLSP
ncbi:MAG TPA: hypothetical protein VI911_02510 [Patescibacteria group bacterium]|nr:hypothetical protein [Patescibacteria group bacterium]